MTRQHMITLNHVYERTAEPWRDWTWSAQCNCGWHAEDASGYREVVQILAERHLGDHMPVIVSAVKAAAETEGVVVP